MDILQHADYNMQFKSTYVDEDLIMYVNEYCKETKSDTFVVSLSGGVDSMVIATILHHLGHKVICFHINYNNREESQDEYNFLERFCEENGMIFEGREITFGTRTDMKRSVYEEKTRNFRFDGYRYVLSKYDAHSVFLGHHDDDIIENVFMNVCKGRNILDLTVMERESHVEGVTLSRPLIGRRKSDVYDFAHFHKIPYFRDTTPSWSMRGMYRTQVYPLLNTMYSSVDMNLISISEQSVGWNGMIDEFIIQPFWCKLMLNIDSVTFEFASYENAPLCFWRHVLPKLLHSYKKPTPTLKSIDLFTYNIQYRKKTVLAARVCSMFEKDQIIIKMNA